VEENFADHPHWPLLVAAYRQFRAGMPQAALDLLQPVLEHDESANRPSVVAGVLWGLAGDCFFRLDKPDEGFRAYRRAIELDGNCGCLALFACQVARHRRAEYAAEALRCLRASRAADWRALRQHPVHFLWHSLGPEALYFRFVRVPLARWRLRRLAARAKG
jgi:hypothetical protein